jgi:hypothetical protein
MATQETHPQSSVSLSYVNAGTPAKGAVFLCVQVPSQANWKGRRGETPLDVGHSSKPLFFFSLHRTQTNRGESRYLMQAYRWWKVKIPSDLRQQEQGGIAEPQILTPRILPACLARIPSVLNYRMTL